MASTLPTLIEELIETSKQIGILTNTLETMKNKPTEELSLLKLSLECSLRICEHYVEDLEDKILNNFKPK